MAKSKSPVPSDRAPSLQRFSLEDLAPFTREGTFAKSASRDFHLFYVGRDDVHGILKYLLSRAQASLYLNMFGYDDEELNAECMRCALDASITTVITLDKSQAGGKHEKGVGRARGFREVYLILLMARRPARRADPARRGVADLFDHIQGHPGRTSTQWEPGRAIPRPAPVCVH
jgi:hypothetical protein